MGLVTNITQFIAGTPALASEVNANFDAIVSVLNGQIEDVNVSELSASKIGSGEFDVARIPNLPADRITSGVFHGDRIPAITVDKVPNLPASKITSGTLGADRVPSLAPNKITGTAVTVSGAQVVSGEKTFEKVNLYPAGGRPSDVNNPWGASGGRRGTTSFDATSSTGNSPFFGAFLHVHPVDSRGFQLAASTGNQSDDFRVRATNDQTGAWNSWRTIALRNSNNVFTGSNTFSVIPTLPDSNPTSINHAVRKKYVDDGLAGKANTNHTHTAANITSGTFSADRIPNLSAAKITSGTMAADRVSGVVTTSGNQSISGTKTFTGNLVLPVR